jgi:hypothetical protein
MTFNSMVQDLLLAVNSYGKRIPHEVFEDFTAWSFGF